jgi:hypothetical protein
MPAAQRAIVAQPVLNFHSALNVILGIGLMPETSYIYFCSHNFKFGRRQDPASTASRWIRPLQLFGLRKKIRGNPCNRISMTEYEEQSMKSPAAANPRSARRLILNILLSLAVIGAGLAGAAYITKSAPKAQRRPPQKVSPLVQVVRVQRMTMRWLLQRWVR